MWPFRKRKPEPEDRREWNEDWKVGDIAECVVDSERWHPDVMPWLRPALGQRFVVIGFVDAISGVANVRCYFLELKGWPTRIETGAFRKVQPSPDRKREEA